MPRLQWAQPGQSKFETGVDRGVLFVRDKNGDYKTGVPWVGLTNVTQSPSGAESNKTYADNRVYLNLKSAEEFGATIEALFYPDEFAECDGTAEIAPGVFLGQQSRSSFAFSYRTRVGNELEGYDHGYKVHIIYGADAAPTEQAHGTINDSPEPTGFSWELTTTPLEVGIIDGVEYKPSAKLTIDSTKVPAAALETIENILYGTAGADSRLPLPAEVVSILTGALTTVETATPAFVPATNTLTIPVTTGVEYLINGSVAAGNVVITEDTVVEARATEGYKFDEHSDSDWTYRHTP